MGEEKLQVMAAEESLLSQLPVAVSVTSPVLIFQELLSINWLFVLCQTMQIYYTQQYSGVGGECLQPSLFCSTSPIEGLYDVLIRKLTGAMHNLLSSLVWWALGGQLGAGQCLPFHIMTKTRVAVGLAAGGMGWNVQMCNHEQLGFTCGSTQMHHLLRSLTWTTAGLNISTDGSEMHWPIR